MYRKKSGIIGIIITIIILIALVFLSNVSIENLSYIEKTVGSLVMPIQNGVTFLKNKISGNSTFFSDVTKLKEENQKLKDNNSKLEQELRELEFIKAENETLKEYVELSKRYGEYSTVPAYVINKDIGNYTSIIVINAGSKDGLKPNMPVIAEEGLVGHVISVTNSTAKVQTIVDNSNTVSCSISTTKDSIIARGTLEEKSSLKATYIPTDANLIQQDSVETSGMGGIYPKGILVGFISQIVNTKNITDRYAIISTAVDFEKLMTVLVITT